MAQSSVALHDLFAAASGSDSDLAQELRSALLGRALCYVELLKDAQDVSQWQAYARRLSSLAASYCAAELQAAAQAALLRPPADAAAVRRITRAITNLQV